jgi:hypothetical protein
VALLATVQHASFALAEDERTFDPHFEATAGDELTVDSIRDYALRITQNDGTAPVRDHLITLPSWRFAVGSVRPSDLSSCGQLNQDSQTSGVNHMEAVGTAIIKLQNDDTRKPSAATDPALKAAGRPTSPPPGPATYMYGAGVGGIWFRQWDPTTSTAHLCGDVVTGNSRIDAFERAIVFDLDLQLQPDKSWTLNFNLARALGTPAGSSRSITDNPYYLNRHLSLTEIRLSFRALTFGNWNLDSKGDRCPTPTDKNPNLGAPCQIVFSRSPLTAGDYVVRAQLARCEASVACRWPPAIREVPMPVAPTISFVHEVGRLIGPAGPSPLPLSTAFILGNDVTFSWEQPHVLHGEHTKGYLLVVAPPGVQELRHSEYVIIDPAADGFDPRQPCGSDGTQTVCSLKLNFPLSTQSGKLLRPDGQYDAALVTLTVTPQSRFARRSDGLCDDGTLDGIKCPATEPIFRSEKPVVSTLEFVIRSASWPFVFDMAFDSRMTECDLTRAPNSQCSDGYHLLLLIDFVRRRAEVVRWRYWVPYEVFTAPANTIVGTDTAGGVVSFAGNSVLGNAVTWRFDGVVNSGAAAGIFTVINGRGLPNTPNGMPVYDVRVFNGKRVTQ